MNRWFTTADENAAPGGMTGLVGAFSLEVSRNDTRQRDHSRMLSRGQMLPVCVFERLFDSVTFGGNKE